MNNPRIGKNGNKYWFNNKGQLHREDGPAIEWHNGTKMWYINGNLHREDGPAIEFNCGQKQWWYNGEFVDSRDDFTQEDFERLLKIKEYW